MYAGCVKLGYQPMLNITREDWEDSLTWNGALLTDDGELSFESFETAITWQLMLYAQRLMSYKMRESVKHEPKYATIFFVLKLALMQTAKIQMPETSKSKDPTDIPLIQKAQSPMPVTSLKEDPWGNEKSARHLPPQETGGVMGQLGLQEPARAETSTREHLTDIFVVFSLSLSLSLSPYSMCVCECL